MKGPYGFDTSDSCQNCGLRSAGFFCQLNPATLKDFNAARTTATYPGGALLFLEKQDPRGVFVLCAGEVKLSISSSAGKTLILRIARPGEILGLMAALTNTSY
ncbi:MAG TPA: cyclic nucleotide-binding domain-containing protein, partial [Methylomirabilota bacterium]|nr:cyclic nucleotide-binding domain-containing protein [Methylomirabilota bacterium]